MSLLSPTSPFLMYFQTSQSAELSVALIPITWDDCCFISTKNDLFLIVFLIGYLHPNISRFYIHIIEFFDL